MLADPCADPRIFARVVPGPTARKQLQQRFCLFCPQFYSFTVAYKWVISKKSIILLGFGGGGPTYSKGSNFFHGGGGGGGGSKCLF